MPRPRKHPEGTDLKAAQRKLRQAAGILPLQIELSARGREILDRIREETGARSRAAVIERLLEEEMQRRGDA